MGMATNVTSSSFTAAVEQISEELKPPPGAKPAADVLIDPKSPVLTPHVDPYDAAKQIRKLARQLVDNTENNVGVSQDALTYIKYAQQNQYEEEHWIGRIREAAKTRRVAAVHSALADLNSVRHTTRKRIESAINYYPAGSGASSNVKKTAEEIHKLAQSLPTIATAPVLPVDQVLRGVATLLKNAGYFDEKGSPVKP